MTSIINVDSYFEVTHKPRLAFINKVSLSKAALLELIWLQRIGIKYNYLINYSCNVGLVNMRILPATATMGPGKHN